MASLLYNSFWEDLFRGAIDLDTDTFKFMLVTSAYVPDKDTHLKRSAVTNEVVGTGYTAGGQTVACTVSKNTATDQIDATFGAPAGWAGSTITARGGVIYKSRGGASTADELVGYVDFGGDVISTSGNFAASFSSPVRVQN